MTNFTFTTLNNRQASLVGVQTWDQSESHYSNNADSASALLKDNLTGNTFSVPFGAVVIQLAQQGLVPFVNIDGGMKKKTEIDFSEGDLYKSGPFAHDQTWSKTTTTSYEYNHLEFLNLNDADKLLEDKKLGSFELFITQDGEHRYSLDRGFDLHHRLVVWWNLPQINDYDPWGDFSAPVLNTQDDKVKDYVNKFNLEGLFRIED